MPIDSYETMGSPPCRLVRLAAAALGVELNLKQISLQNLEHITPEYLKINPQHTIPTINDNGFIMCESRAIITYLANQYDKDDLLYPKDPKKRALVDQRLYFDACTLYKAAIDYYVLNYDLGKYKNVKRWFARIKSEAPNYEDNEAGAKAFKQWSEDMKN